MHGSVKRSCPTRARDLAARQAGPEEQPARSPRRDAPGRRRLAADTKDRVGGGRWRSTAVRSAVPQRRRWAASAATVARWQDRGAGCLAIRRMVFEERGQNSTAVSQSRGSAWVRSRRLQLRVRPQGSRSGAPCRRRAGRRRLPARAGPRGTSRCPACATGAACSAGAAVAPQDVVQRVRRGRVRERGSLGDQVSETLPSGSVRDHRIERLVDAEPAAVERFLEFFAVSIANERTRAACGRAVGQFLAWCGARGLGSRSIAPLHVAAYIRTHPGSVPTVKQHLAAIRALCDWLVVHHVLPVNPAASVRGPKHVVTKGATPVLDAGRDARAPGPDRHGDARGAAGPGASECHGVQLRAGERGGGDAAAGLLPAGRAGVAAAAREGQAAPRRAGAPPGRGGGRDVRRRRRPRGRAGAALPERGPVGAAERSAAGASSGSGDDQATGGGGGAAVDDVLPHVPGDRHPRRTCRTGGRWSTRSGSRGTRRRRRRSSTTGRRTRSRSTRSSAS